jgi:hypothetical protein
MKSFMFGALGALGLLVIGGVACSSGTSTASNGTTGQVCNPSCGDDCGGGSSSSGGHDTNPDGVAYPNPAGGYGHTARTGNTPGSVIANFKFLGYPGGNVVSDPMPTISLADYYDPCQKRYKLIHLSVAAVWCVPCNDETDAMVAAKSQLDSEGVVLLQALDDGPIQGTPATENDLKYWIRNHNSNFTEMLDPGLQNLAGFFNAAAIPWNADIDPRTMEILDSSDGWSGSISSEIDPGVLPSTPGYPLGTSCN